MDVSSADRRPVLAETPVAIASGSGRRFMLFNVSRLCNQNCSFCWTSQTPFTIRRQTACDSIDWLTEDTLSALLARFKQTGGDVLAVMSEGEPLVGVNLEFIRKLARLSGALDFGLLIFTNGEELTGQTISDLSGLNRKISYSISVNGGSQDVYDRLHGRVGAFERVMANRQAWVAYDDPEIHRIAIHTVITAESCEAEMDLIRRLASDLGGVPWFVTTMGDAGSARINPSVRPGQRQVDALVRKHATGPTATSSQEKNCSYISSAWHEGSMYGVTIHPFNQGAVQACPYLSNLGTGSWFNLKQFLQLRPRTAVEIGFWLDYATLMQSMITTAAFFVVGYDHCLMRHKKNKQVESFLAAVNEEMNLRVRSVDTSAHAYFEILVGVLSEVLDCVSSRCIGKAVEVDVFALKEMLRIGLPITGEKEQLIFFKKKIEPVL